MFDAIAPRYDVLNRVLSAGIDRGWRRRAIAALALSGRERVLDVCCGTADLALAARRAAPGARRIVGVDFSANMLAIGRDKVVRAGEAGAVALARGDAARLPVADRSVDAVTVAFGIRNVHDVPAACAELRRVLRPGGRLAILEFAMPSTPLLGALYRWYFRSVLPRVGRLVSRHREAYSYLPASVGAFAPPAELVKILRQAGFRDASAVPLTFGVVYLYTARV